jgi:hypothetical protein
MNDIQSLTNESCMRITDRAWEYHASGISPLERSRVDVHLAHCADCRKHFEQIRLLHLTIENQKLLTSNPFLATRILSMNKAKKSVLFANPIHAEVFAILVIGVFVFGGVFTGSFFAGKYIQTDDSHALVNESEILAEQIMYDETDCFIPGYEILNEKP